MNKISSMEEIRKRELNILKYVHYLCEKHNLRYIMAGGTLLGAIRHKGYIPWDDDIDLLMPREDYERLIRIINNNKNKNFRFLTCTNEKDYYLPFGRVTDTRTYLEFEGEISCENMGIFVDIFPIDGLTDNEKFQKKEIKIYENFRKQIDFVRCTSSATNVMKIYAGLLCRISNFIAKRTKYTHSETVACKVVGLGEREIIDKELVENRIKVEFEGELFYAPAGYDTYLTNLYKDYMKLPPKNQQRRGHVFQGWYKKKEG